MVDLGCGIKPYQNEILNAADSYLGVDWTNTDHKLNCDIVSDLNKPLLIENETVNTVVSFQVLEHLHNPQNMLDESYRILKKNGYIILTVPFQWMVHEEPYDYFRYTPFGLERMLKKAGFNDIKITPNAGFFSMIILKSNYFSKRFINSLKFLKFLFKILVVPIWFVSQLLAQFLDKLDKNKDLDCVGYTIIAKKE